MLHIELDMSAATYPVTDTLAMPKPKGRRQVTHKCEYQVVWSSKYARPVLADHTAELRQLLSNTATDLGVDIASMTLTDNVVSLQMSIDPTVGVHRVVSQLKAVSSSTLRSRHASLKTRIPSLWNSKYFVASVGAGARPDELQAFLEQQRKG